MSDLSALALNAAATLSPSELHGVVCGLAVCHPEEFHIQRLLDLVGVEALTDQQSVEAFVSAALEALVAEDLSFSLLLPDDDSPVGLRVEALAEWSGGFLAGIGAGLGGEGWESLPDDAQEVVEDLSAVTELDAAQVGGAEDLESAESDLIQVQEFVKVGVLLIMGLLHDHHGD